MQDIVSELFIIRISPANETDAQGLERVCPSQGAVYADKDYCTAPASHTLKARGCHDATIKKNNMKSKNKDLDQNVRANSFL